METRYIIEQRFVVRLPAKRMLGLKRHTEKRTRLVNRESPQMLMNAGDVQDIACLCAMHLAQQTEALTIRSHYVRRG